MILTPMCYYAKYYYHGHISLPDCWDENEALRLGPGGSNISLYLDTISTEMKYTTAKDKNWACLVSSWKWTNNCHLLIIYLQNFFKSISKFIKPLPEELSEHEKKTLSLNKKFPGFTK